MDYYNKYLKYKNKYLELKGGINSKQKRANKRANEIVKELLVEKPTHILFMFLGGLPLKNEHWCRFIETSNEKLICVVHPMILEGYEDKIKGTFWETLLKKERLIIVNKDHHIKTSWGTKSLTDAQLMIMQYALIKKGRIFKKYVLISENDAPLYNFNVMYKELNLDSKSWFSFFAKKLIRQNWKKLYKHEGGIFDFDEIDVASQWNAIDDSHLEFYFDPKKLYENKPTYKKIDRDFTICNNKSINIVETIPGTDIKYQKYLDATNGYTSNKLSKLELENINNAGFCIVTDGLFFNAILKHELKERKLKLLDNLRYNEIAYLEDTKNHKQFISPLDWENEYLCGGIKQSFINNNVWNDMQLIWDENFRGEFSKINRIWYGSNITFNQDRLLLNFTENKDYIEDSWRKSTQKKWLLFENGILKQYTEEEKQKKINEFCSSLKEYIDIDRAKELYIISNSYTDFSLVSLDPNNVLREFNYKKLIEDNKNLDLFEGKNIGKILKEDPNINLINLINEKDRKSIKIKVPEEEFTINLKRHPLEYSKWNLSQIINAYNFIIFFEIDKEQIKNNFLKDKEIPLYIYERIRNYVKRNNFHTIKKETFIKNAMNILKNSYILNKNILKFKLTILGLLEEYNNRTRNIKGKYAYRKAKYYYERMIKLNKNYVEEFIDNDKKYYKFKTDVVDSIKFNNDYGVPITSFFLNNALTNGSLFIRKSTDTSNIEKFTDQLFIIDEYALKNTKEYPLRPLINSKDIPYEYRTFEDSNKIDDDNLCKEIEELYKDDSNDLYILYLLSKNKYWNGIMAAKDFGKNNHILIKPILSPQFQTCNSLKY